MTDITALLALREGTTPGPWTQDSDHDICGGHGWLIACPAWPDIGDTHVTWPEMHANARLIAAAPDLLDALEALRAERDAALDRATAAEARVEVLTVAGDDVIRASNTLMLMLVGDLPMSKLSVEAAIKRALDVRNDWDNVTRAALEAPHA